MDGMGQHLLAGTGLAQQQHRAHGLGRPPRLALDLDRSRAAAHKAGKAVFAAARTLYGRLQAAAALGSQLAPRFIEIALQHRKLADQRLQGRLGLIEQHNADGTDHATFIVMQRQAADDKGSGAVGQQIDQDRLAGLQHAAHLRVGDDLLHLMPEKIAHTGYSQAWQKTLVAFVDPDNAPASVDQKHALTH